MTPVGKTVLSNSPDRRSKGLLESARLAAKTQSLNQRSNGPNTARDRHLSPRERSKGSNPGRRIAAHQPRAAGRRRSIDTFVRADWVFRGLVCRVLDVCFGDRQWGGEGSVNLS